MRFEFRPIEPAPTYNVNSREEWQSWIWQMQHALTSQSDFERVFTLTPEECHGFEVSRDLFKISATPYYATLAAREPALRRILIPQAQESLEGAQQMLDPLAEDVHSPSRNLIHRYSDRVLFLVTDTCSVYCRYCTRKRFTGQEQGLVSTAEYQKALEYIKSHNGIREVIFSGGDPLTLSNKVLDRVLTDIRSIEHIEIIRIGTRMPVVNPMRMDEELAQIFRKHAPVFLLTHFNHPKELTLEAADALSRVIDRGVPVFNQMVLLNGVNNSASVVQALSRRLLYLRVKPYYMHQCDPSEGTDHLRTTVESSESLVRELWGHLSGLAMPTLSLDIPNGGGKTTIVPNFMVEQRNTEREYIGWDGRRGIYRNPIVEVLIPHDSHEYDSEWAQLKNSKK